MTQPHLETKLYPVALTTQGCGDAYLVFRLRGPDLEHEEVQVEQF
jgi:hypothetical protein